jgi:hypothetical protein
MIRLNERARAAFSERQPFFQIKYFVLLPSQTRSSNDYHSVVMAVVVMMMPAMAIRLCIGRSREEGDESKHQ